MKAINVLSYAKVDSLFIGLLGDLARNAMVTGWVCLLEEVLINLWDGQGSHWSDEWEENPEKFIHGLFCMVYDAGTAARSEILGKPMTAIMDEDDAFSYNAIDAQLELLSVPGRNERTAMALRRVIAALRGQVDGMSLQPVTG